MNVTTTSCTPAVTCTGMLAKRSMSFSPAGAPPPRSTNARSASPDLLPEDFLAIDQHDHRCLVLDPAWVVPEIEVSDRDAVLPVRRERILEPRAAPRTERHAVHIAILVAGSRRREGGFDDLWHRLAYCDARDGPGGIDVLLQEGG